MAYTPNIPQANDNISDSQPLLLGNFQQIATAFNKNHGNFNAADEGKHTFLQLPEKAPAPTTAANEAGLYAAEGAMSGITELVFRRENDGTSIPFTEFLGAQVGWFRLPCGLLVKWGLKTTIAGLNSGVNAITYDTGPDIPAFGTAVYALQLTQYSLGGGDDNTFTQIVAFGNPLNFDVFASARITAAPKESAFYYIAIGI
jgi:hypothetical protein